MNYTANFNLFGKVALVTGCDRGIGEAMALGLALAGADIIGVFRSLPLQASEIEQQVNKAGKSFKAFNLSMINFITLKMQEQLMMDILFIKKATT